MALCRPVYPVATLNAIDAAGNKATALQAAIFDKLKNDAGLQAIIKTRTNIDAPYNIGNIGTVLADQTVRGEIIRRTQDVYFSLVR
jgi:hypothetical protein